MCHKNGVFVPEKASKDVIDTVNQTIREVVASSDVEAKFAAIGIVGRARHAR